MKPFTFSPSKFANDFETRGYVHVCDGVSIHLLELARRQLASCRHSGRNELSAREIKSKKKQYLFDLPDDEEFLPELFAAISLLTGSPLSAMTLSERHIMIYDDNAEPSPPLHKDRLASTFSVGIPLEGNGCDRIALMPLIAREENLLDNATYYEQSPGSSPRVAKSENVASSDSSCVTAFANQKVVELEARPGDAVIFRGSSIYHGRLHAAGSSVLYFKFNAMRLDPLGEDPSTDAQRATTLDFLSRTTDAELLTNVVELSPRLQHLSQQYSRIGWRTVLRASVSGQPEFTISQEDLQLLLSLRGEQQIVRDVLIELGVPDDQLISHVYRLRRLGKLGGLDFRAA